MAVRDQVFIDLITETKKTVEGVKNFAIGIGVALAAVKGLQKGMDAAIDAAKYGSELRQLRRAFKSMASSVGEDSRSVIKSLSVMAGGTISELELMRSASKAALLGLPVDQLDDLMKIARASATATGADVQTMFNDIVTGVARASPLILDNLGIVIKIGKANEEYAKSLGKTAKELTAKEKQMATLNATLKAGKIIIEKVGEAGENLTDVERWQQLSAAAADFKGELGLIAMDAFRPIIVAASDFVRMMAEGLKTGRELKELFPTIKELAAKGSEGFEDVEGSLKKFQARVAITNQALAGWAKATDDFTKNMGKNIQWSVDELKKEKVLFDSKIAMLKTMISLQATGKALASAAKVAIVEQTESQIMAEKVLQDTINAWGVIDEKASLALEDIDVKSELAAAALAGINELLESGLGFSANSPAVVALKDMHDSMVDIKKVTKEIVSIYQDDLDIALEVVRDLEAAWESATVSADKQKEKIKEVKTATEEFAETIGTLLVDNYLLAAEAWGTMVDQNIDGIELMGKMFKDMIVTMIKALAEMLAVEAIAAFARLNIAQGIGLLVAAGAVSAAAGAIPSLDEGGITKRDTMAMLHKDEAVIPLNRAGSLGTTNIYHIRGSMLAEEKTIRRISRRQALKTRNY